MQQMRYWEIIADKLSATGWKRGYCSTVTPYGWPWVVDAYRGEGKCYVIESDELLNALLDLEAVPLRTRVEHALTFDCQWRHPRG